MHQEAFRFIAVQLASLPPRKSVIEIGSRDINGSVRPLFASAESFTGIDIAPGRGVDIVADAATFEPDEPVDTVVCCEVLEHTENAAKIIANAAKMLQPGGVFLMTAATDPRKPHSAVDGAALREGEHYENISEKQLTTWLKKSFQDIDITVDERHGDIYAAATKASAE